MAKAEATAEEQAGMIKRSQLHCELDAAFFHLYLPAEKSGDKRPAKAEMANSGDTIRIPDELRRHNS